MSVSAVASAAPALEPVVLVVGDSLSAGYGMRADQGWVALLAARLGRERPGWRAVNSSISGDTTRSGVGRLPRALAVHRPAVVVIELGANDGLRGIPIATTRANLERMVALVRAAGAEVLLVGTRLPPNYGPDWSEAFHAVYTGIASEQRVPLLPVLVDERIVTDPGLMQADGLHPSPAAQPALLDKVWPLLLPLLRQDIPASNAPPAKA